MRTYLSLAIAAATVVVASAPRAWAESPAYECGRELFVRPPAPSFPANSTTPIEVSIQDPDPREAFEDYPAPGLFVETETGWEPVEYETRPAVHYGFEDPLSPDLVVTAYQEGRHIVTWDSGCGEVSPVDASDVVAAAFEVLPPAEPPTALGAPFLEGRAVGGERPSWRATYGVELDASWEPWLGSMRAELEVNGETVWGPSGGAAADFVFTDEYTYDCGRESFPPGEYDGVVVARAGGLELRSEPFAFEIVCLPPEEKGCAVAGGRGGSWAPLAVVAAFVLRRRRAKKS